jgi:hypothetical protein
MKRPALVFTAAALLAGACGDVRGELITSNEPAPEPCTSNMDCAPSNPVCDLTTGLCGPCRTDGDCPASAPRCSATLGACVECQTDTASTDCANTERSLCDPQQGRCVECLADGHCTEATERCSLKLGLCAAYCGQGQLCPAQEICDVAIGSFCVECIDDSDCGTDGPCRSSECAGRL